MRALVAAVAGASVMVGAVPRIMLASGRLPDWLRPFVWSDPLHTYLRDGGVPPYLGALYEYPPLTAAVSALLSLIAREGTAYVTLWAIVVAVAAAGTGWLLADAGGTRALGRWSLAPQLALLGTINFDLLACACVVAALRASGARAGLWLALGTAAKLYPGILLPLARAPLALATFAAATALLWLPALAMPHPPQEGLRFYGSLGSNLDSIWGILARLLGLGGVPAAESIVLALTVAGLLATLGLTLRTRLRRADRTTLAAIAIVSLLLWSRRYSPQYSLWILPFFVLLPLPRRLWALLAAADVAVVLTVSPLTLIPRPTADGGTTALLGALAAAVFARHAALLLTLRWLLARPMR